MKMKKIIATVLALVLVAGISIGGTVAYLQDTNEVHNVMTMHNVHIAQEEYERTFNADGTVSGMKSFTQNKPLYPAVVTNGTGNAAWQPAGSDNMLTYADHLGSDYKGANGLWENLNNVQDKFVFVKNTGTTDVYYRTIILLEADETNTYNSNGKAMIHLNVNGHSNFEWIGGTDIDANTTRVNVGGETYYVKVALYKEILTPDEISRPSLLQVGMDQMATNEIVAQFGNTYDIQVLTQAVQAPGWEATTDKTAAQVALDTAFGEITTANVQSWFGVHYE